MNRLFKNAANRPPSHLWALHCVFVSKMNRFFKMPQTVQPCICGCSFSYFSFKTNSFFKMPQTVHPFICGRFIVYFSLKWIYFSKRHKPFIFQICFEMTLRVTIDWKIHKTCLWIFSTFEFSLFFQIWSSLEKQKYGFLLTRGKNVFFI